jgi:hypothetical protein
VDLAVRRGSYTNALLRRFRRILSKYTAEYSMAGIFKKSLVIIAPDFTISPLMSLPHLQNGCGE